MTPSAPVHPAVAAPPTGAPQQRVIKVRRDYNAWVARETMEDYALRFTPRSFRKWSEWRVAHTALGGAASFLVLEAVGATLLLQFGFVNAFWAIVATGLVIFAAGLPISVYAAKYGLDMDLLTRGAGFGYIGSTITSLVYASFTFIFFALEAAIMAYALELAFDIPPAWGYLLCALVVIPLVTHGVTAISQLQAWTLPLWLVLLVLPYVYVFQAHPNLIADLRGYAGEDGQGGAFDPLLFGAALTVGVALITQMGEQVDYLRFMPEKTRANRWRWWAGVLVGGPGWVLPGVLKMLGGALLATLALTLAVPADRAVDPNQMYLAAYETVFSNYGWAVAATALLVVVSQLKINVTNAYAGSLAWSNFFARLTHSHPGRVVWMVFNTLIALMLMELEVFQAIGGVLGLYANIAISWIMAVVADLVVNKPLGLSPKGVEFKRAHLYDFNPVGVGAMGAASLLSVLAYLGVFGAAAQAFSAVIAMAVAFVTAPLIAWATQGRYYIARTSPEAGADAATGAAHAADAGSYLGSARRVRPCVICERPYEGEDMASCPAYGGPICSLCCSLDARCHDLCKPEAARAAVQFNAVLQGADAAGLVAATGHRTRPLPAADGGGGAGAGGADAAAVPRRAAPAGRRRAGRRAGPARAPHQGLLRAAAGGRRHRLVAGAHADEPPRGAGRVQPPDRGAGAGDRLAPPHRPGTAARQARRRGRQPGQDPLYLGREPRVAHAAEQHPGLCAAARRGRHHARAPQAGGGRHPPRRRAPAGADRGHAGHRAHRGRQAGAGPQAACACARRCARSCRCSNCRPAPRACASSTTWNRRRCGCAPTSGG